METIRNMAKRANEAFFPGLFMLLVVYFGYHAIQGDWGLIRYLQLDQQIAQLEQDAELVTAQREALQHRVTLISHIDGVDPDMLDEQARYMLGFSHPEDFVIFTGNEMAAEAK
jgi:cell division protein FtsB